MFEKIKEFLIKTPESKWFRNTLKVLVAGLCILAVLVLTVNITLIVKGYTDKENMPSFMGYIPVIVCVDDMKPILKDGDLAVCKKTDVGKIEKDDIISYYNSSIYGESVITKRVSDVRIENGEIYFHTISENGDALSEVLVYSGDVVGVYKFKIVGAGRLLLFMQTTTGLIVFVIVPLVLFTLYEVSVRMRVAKEREEQTEQLQSQLDELKKEISEKNESDE